MVEINRRVEQKLEECNKAQDIGSESERDVNKYEHN